MKKGRVVFALVAALFLVLTVGIVLASVIPNACSCYEGCYACVNEQCKVVATGGACFCLNNPCRLSEHLVCCLQH